MRRVLFQQNRTLRLGDPHPNWHITGDWFDNCSFAVACPCTFAQAPDNGFCESVLFWHIRSGHYGDINLDDLSFVRVGRWEGDSWAGRAKGAAGVFIDERADERQAEVLPLIFGGRAGGLRREPENARHKSEVRRAYDRGWAHQFCDQMSLYASRKDWHSRAIGAVTTVSRGRPRAL